MTVPFEPLTDLEAKIAAGDPLGRADAERVMACPDLISVGVLGERARVALHGSRVTFCRVCVIGGDALPASLGEAREVRLVGKPASGAEARERVRAAARLVAGRSLTAFSLADLVELVNHDDLALAELARALRAEGLAGVAEAPVDRLGEAEQAAEIVRAARHGGLAVRRLTIDRAMGGERLDLLERAAAVQRDAGGLAAFAPLPRHDPHEAPSTGYDDVKTIAAARLVCRAIPSIQVDWPLYGPKLAQVAIAYGADDLDGIAPVDDPAAGARRAPRAEIERQIRAAGGEPVERDGAYAVLG